MGWYKYPRYVSVAEKREKASKKVAQLKKKNPEINPVSISGNSLAKSWWGKSWNSNLEGYADYSNRIGRGRSYVRHGAVLDLRISEGRIEALVQGSASKPYEVVITIKKLSPTTMAVIKMGCRGKLSSLRDLLDGKFPKELRALFLAQGTGLFPSPEEISLDCSCPDWAVMCKHVAATLYGVGARLDEDPLLFFKLRSVEVEDLVAGAVRERTGDLLGKTEIKSDKIIEDGDLSDLFGIELDDPSDLVKPQPMKKAAKSKKKKAEPKKKGHTVEESGEKLKKSPRQTGSSKKTSAKKKNRRSIPENLRKAIEKRSAAIEQSKKTPQKATRTAAKKVSRQQADVSKETIDARKPSSKRKSSGDLPEKIAKVLEVRKAILKKEAGQAKQTNKKVKPLSTKSTASKNTPKELPVSAMTVIENWKKTMGK